MGMTGQIIIRFCRYTQGHTQVPKPLLMPHLADVISNSSWILIDGSMNVDNVRSEHHAHLKFMINIKLFLLQLLQ